MSQSNTAVAVIIVAAGSGSRLGADVPKAFVELGGRSLLERSVYSVLGMSQQVQLIVVAPAARVDEARALCATATGGSNEVVVVVGGATRQASVAAGLAAVEAAVTIVLVHDAARALTPSTQFDRIVTTIERTGNGAIPGLAVSDTIKRVAADATVLETVDRAQLAAVQTPQGFPRDQLDAAYAAATDAQTDDAALLAAIGHPVGVIDGDPQAFKITTAWDLRRAQQLLAQPAASAYDQRVGVGTDSHAFDASAELWLAGLNWPGEPGLAGHSDGDAVAHAITDALLSAAGFGDIGGTFGTADPQFSGAHGDVFLRETRNRLEAAGYRIGNVSVQLIGNHPRFAPRRLEAQSVLAGILGAPVSVTATTTDALGFTGRGEGISAIATALIFRARNA